MSDIITERSGNILRIRLNRPEKKNAMTLAMYITLADLLNDAAKDDQIRVVLWHGAGDSFSAGNDIQDFLKNPPGAGESPQARLIEALINFDKPIVVAVQGAAIGGGTTMLTHCDFVFAGETAKFRMPFVDLALGPESERVLGLRTKRIPARRRASLLRITVRCEASRRTRFRYSRCSRSAVITDRYGGRATAGRQTAGALQACKRLIRTSTRDQLERAVKLKRNSPSASVPRKPRKRLPHSLKNAGPNFTKTNETANPKARAA